MWVLGGLSHGIFLGMKASDAPERRKWGLQSLCAPRRPQGRSRAHVGCCCCYYYYYYFFYHRFMVFSPLEKENPESWLLIAVLSLCLAAVSGAARTLKERAS